MKKKTTVFATIVALAFAVIAFFIVKQAVEKIELQKMPQKIRNAEGA